jgi:hypothetical protein
MLLRDLFDVDPHAINEGFRAHVGRAPSHWVPTSGFMRTLNACFACWRANPGVSSKPVLWLSGASGSGKSSFLGAIAEGLPMLRELGASFEQLRFTQAFVEQPPPMVLLSGKKAVEKFGHEPMATSLLRALNQAHGFAVNSIELGALERILAGTGQIEAFVRGFQARTQVEWKDARERDQILHEDLIKVLASVTGGHDNAERMYEQALAQAQMRHRYLLDLLMQLPETQSRDPNCVVLIDDFESLFGGDVKLQRDAFSLLNEFTLQSAGRIRCIVASTRPLHAMLHELANPDIQVQAQQVNLGSQDALEVLYQRWLHPAGFAKVQLAMLEPGASHPFSAATLHWLDDVLADVPAVHLLELFHSALKDHAGASAVTLLGPAALSESLFAQLPPATAKLVRSAMEQLDPVQAELLATLAISPLGGKATLSEQELTELSQRRLGEVLVPSAALAKLEQQGWIRRLEGGVALSLPESQQRHAVGQVVSLSQRERMRLLAEILFDNTLAGKKMVVFRNTRAYGFNRMCDSQAHGSANHELALTVLSNLAPEYEQFDEFHAVLRSAEGGGLALLRIAPIAGLPERLDEIASARQGPHDSAGGVHVAAHRLEQALASDLESALVNAEVFVAGRAFAAQHTDAPALVDAVMTKLIETVHAHVEDVSHAQNDAIAMIRVVLGGRELPAQENAAALKTLDQYFETRIGQTVSLNDVVQRHRRRPFGWPDLEIVLLIARIVGTKRLNVRIDGHAARPAESAEAFTNAALWPRVMVVRTPPGVSDEMLQAADIGRALFGRAFALTSESALSTQLRQDLESWRQELASMLTAPDASAIAHDARESLVELKRLNALANGPEFLEGFCGLAEVLYAIQSDLNALRLARAAAGPAHARLRQLLQEIRPNLPALTRDNDTAALIERMEKLRSGTSTQQAGEEIERLCDQAFEKNYALVSAARDAAIARVEAAVVEVDEQLTQLDARDDVRASVLQRLRALAERIDLEPSHAALVGICEEAAAERDVALDRINQRITAERPAVGEQRLLTVVRPGKFANNLLIESEADLEPYFERLRVALRPMLRAGMRVRFE